MSAAEPVRVVAVMRGVLVATTFDGVHARTVGVPVGRVDMLLVAVEGLLPFAVPSAMSLAQAREPVLLPVQNARAEVPASPSPDPSPSPSPSPSPDPGAAGPGRPHDAGGRPAAHRERHAAGGTRRRADAGPRHCSGGRSGALAATRAQRLTGVWRARLPGEHAGTTRWVSVGGASHPDGVVVDLPRLALGDDEVVLAEAEQDTSSGRVRRLRPQDPRGRPQEPLWFVEQDQGDADPPAQVLVAFAATAEVPPWSVVRVVQFALLSTKVSEQVGAIRWFSRTGEVHQVYVQPALRRQGTGLAICLAAGTYAVARGWPPLLVGGTRTDLGEAFTRHLPEPIQPRVASRTFRAPDMTPPERAVGVPRRNLLPDESSELER